MNNLQGFAEEALSNATQNSSFANYPAILAGFEAKGISPDAIGIKLGHMDPGMNPNSMLAFSNEFTPT